MSADRLTPSPVNTAALLGLDRNGIMWCDDTDRACYTNMTTLVRR